MPHTVGNTLLRIMRPSALRELRNSSRKSGEEIMQWCDKLFTVCGSISTLGAGFTFTAIVNAIDEPPPGSRFDKVQVRKFLALSWLLFLLSLGYATTAAVLFSFHGKAIERSYNTHSRKAHLGLWVVVAGQQLLILAAVAVSTLAVMTYVDGVGVAGEIFTGLFAALISVLWLDQSM